MKIEFDDKPDLSTIGFNVSQLRSELYHASVALSTLLSVINSYLADAIPLEELQKCRDIIQDTNEAWFEMHRLKPPKVVAE